MKNLFKLINGSKRNISIFLLTILEITLLTIAGISYGNKNLDKYIFGSSDLKNTNIFAIMIGDQDGNYTESTSNTFPGYEYFYNQEKSTCMDLSGKPIENSLLYNQDTKTASITISDTSSCYLYFDEWKKDKKLVDVILNSTEITEISSVRSGKNYYGYNEYRFLNADPNNWICIGANSVDECMNYSENYLYRIIGVFPELSDSELKYYIKVVQFMPNNNYIVFNTDSSDVTFELTSIYNYLYEFLISNTGINSDNIGAYTWKYANTKSYTLQKNPSYIYEDNYDNLIESEIGDSSIDTCKNITADPYANCNGGTREERSFLIGLLSVSDIAYFNKYETSWLMDYGGGYEWILGFAGIDNNSINKAYYINYNSGSIEIAESNVTTPHDFRAVLYLSPENVYDGTGDGTMDNPYLVSSKINSNLNSPSISLSTSDSILKINVTKGSGNLSKYCINTTNSLNGCSWKNISGTSISYTMPNQDTTYYVFVTDDKGFITSSSYYFPLPPLSSVLIASNKMYQSGLDGDGYRFVGTGAYNSSTTPSNFVCFGTTSKSDCTSNPDKYLYRIIGVFNNQVKLIKLTSLPSNIQYANIRFVQTEEKNRIYPNSALNTSLNGSSFLTNTTYDYMQNTKWTNIISENSKNSVNSTTYNGGPNYYNSLTPKQIYLHENNKSGKSSTVGYWGDYTDKITVMDASDYVLSLGSTAVNMTSGTYSNRNTLKTSWIFLGNNKYGNTSGNYTTEHTTSSYGMGTSTSYIYSWTINPSGYLYYTSISNTYAARPVFYLNSDVPSSSGTGTLSDPYILKN